jgi:hypothetical protein
MKQASDKNDYMRMGRLQKLLQVLQDASAPPPEVAFIERLLEAADNPAVETMLREKDDLVNDQFMEALGGLVNQMRTQASKGNVEARALSDKLDAVYKAALAYSMKKRLA